MRFILTMLFTLLALTANAAEAPRTVLAFYNDNGDELRSNPLHLLAEMPFNHLGLKFEYHDIADPLPLDAVTDPSVAGVITWFDNGAIRRPAAFLDWLEESDIYKPGIVDGKPRAPKRALDEYEGDANKRGCDIRL